MQVHIETRNSDAKPMRALAAQRVTAVMRRLAWLVPRANVELSDVNGPRGGVDKRCRVELEVHGANRVVITSLARDWRSAIDQALGRAAQQLLRASRRRHAVSTGGLR